MKKHTKTTHIRSTPNGVIPSRHPVSASIGARIRAIRLSRALTADYFARSVGISGRHLADLEAGRRPLTLALILRAAVLLGCTPPVLLKAVSGRARN